MNRPLNPNVTECLPRIQVKSSDGFSVGSLCPYGRANGFCKGEMLLLVMNIAGPVTPDIACPKRVYPKLKTLIRFGLMIHVYCAAIPWLLSRSVEAGGWT